MSKEITLNFKEKRTTENPNHNGWFYIFGHVIIECRLEKSYGMAYYNKTRNEWQVDGDRKMSIEWWAELPSII